MKYFCCTIIHFLMMKCSNHFPLHWPIWVSMRCDVNLQYTKLSILLRSDLKTLISHNLQCYSTISNQHNKNICIIVLSRYSVSKDYIWKACLKATKRLIKKNYLLVFNFFSDFFIQINIFESKLHLDLWICSTNRRNLSLENHTTSVEN